MGVVVLDGNKNNVSEDCLSAVTQADINLDEITFYISFMLCLVMFGDFLPPFLPYHLAFTQKLPFVVTLNNSTDFPGFFEAFGII